MKLHGKYFSLWQSKFQMNATMSLTEIIAWALSIMLDE